MRALPSGQDPDLAGAAVNDSGSEQSLSTSPNSDIQLHALGSRALYELVTEMVDKVGSSVDARIAEYVDRLTPEMFQATGGDRFPESPMRAIGGQP
jgi:hypothetical protein